MAATATNRKYRVMTGKFGSFTTVADSKDKAIINAAIQYCQKQGIKRELYGQIVSKFRKDQPRVMIVEKLTQRNLLSESAWDKIMHVGRAFAPKLFNPIGNAVDFVKGLKPDFQSNYRGESFTIEEITELAKRFKASRFWRDHNIHGLWTPNLLRYFMSDYLQISYPLSRDDVKRLKLVRLTDKSIRDFLTHRGIIR